MRARSAGVVDAGATAIVHDWFQGYHGSERVVEVLRRDVFPPGSEPDIFTFHAAHELLPPALSTAIVKESRLGRLPGVRQRGHDPGRWRYLLPYMPHYFRGLPLLLQLGGGDGAVIGSQLVPFHTCLPSSERARA